MPTKLKPRQRRILQALEDLGGRATQREIAKVTDLSVNGVSQSLSAMFEHVYRIEWTKKDATWVIRTEDEPKADEEEDGIGHPSP